MRKSPIVVLAAAVATAAIAWSPAVTLRFNLKPGAKYRYATSTSTTNSMAGSKPTTESMVQLITVKSKGAGGYQVVTKIESVDVKGAGAETNQLKGATFTQTVSPTGKTSNMSTTASGQAKMMVSMMQALDAGFLGIVYPTNPVGVGSSWSATLDLTKMMGAIPGGSMMKIVSGGKIPMKYKLSGIKGSGNNRVAGLSISGAGSMTMQVTPPQGQGQPQKITMKFNTSTSAKVDVATGMPSTMDGNATIVMQIMGNTMTQHLKVKMVRK